MIRGSRKWRALPQASAYTASSGAGSRYPEALPILMAAGFDQTKARFQLPFDDDAAAHLGNAAQHVESLIGYSVLVAELEREKDQLQCANQTLEQRDRALLATSKELRATNETLEFRVRERTQKLTDRNRDMRLVLDNVAQAFVTIDAEGRLAQERSAIVDRWFGAYEGNPLFADYVARVDPSFAASFSLGFEAVREDLLPLSLCLYQLPSQLREGKRQFRVVYAPLMKGDTLTGLLIVANDVTDQIRRAQEEAEQTEMLTLFQGMMRDRAGYLGFVAEVSGTVAQLAREDLSDSARALLLHTLKGNAGMIGASVIASLCHETEDAF